MSITTLCEDWLDSKWAIGLGWLDSERTVGLIKLESVNVVLDTVNVVLDITLCNSLERGSWWVGFGDYWWVEFGCEWCEKTTNFELVIWHGG